MRVAILYNPRPEATPGAPDDAHEEYDEAATIEAIAGALAAMGVEPVPVIADAAFPDTLKNGRVDFVFNIAEGTGRRCREAVPAAICEFLGIPFTGSDALTLAATLDKTIARRIVSPDVPVARGILLESPDDESMLATLTFPVVVKPNDEGSSKGITRASRCVDMSATIERSRRLHALYNCPVLVEEFLPGMEVTAAVRGNGREASLIGLMEIASADEREAPFLYCLETKRDFRRQVRYHVPPRLEAARLDRVAAYALQVYQLLGCRDIARIDFRLDSTSEPRFLECNPLPGLSPDSSDLVILSRALWAESEQPYHRLVQGILRDGAQRYGLRL